MNTGWLLLIAGTIGEVAWVMTLKSTDGFTKLWPSLFNLAIAIFNIVVLSKAFNVLPTAFAYSIWVGLSAAAITIIAWQLQGESLTTAKLGCILLIIVGVVGLKFCSTQDNKPSGLQVEQKQL